MMKASAPPGNVGTFQNARETCFASLVAAEDRHFWFRSRNKVISAAIAPLVAPLPDGFRVLEVGCGTGNVLRVLERLCARGEVIGLEMYEEGLQYARQRTRCQLVAADIYDAPFDQPFDLIGLFDVLEHLHDDEKILGTLRENLKPDGRLVLTVPAHQSLWSYADEYSAHYRRYSPESLRRVLQGTGFEVEYLTQFMMALYPVMWLTRRLNTWSQRQTGPAVDAHELTQRELKVGTVTNAIMYASLCWEAAWIARRWCLPLGTSLLAVARRTR